MLRVILSCSAILCLQSAAVYAQDATATAPTISSAQVSSGSSLYARQCASCHGGQLEGTNDAPALTGTNYSAYWPGKSVEQLFAHAQDNMPPAAPGTLTAENYLHLTALILSKNGVTPGEEALPEDKEALSKQIIPTL